MLAQAELQRKSQISDWPTERKDLDGQSHWTEEDLKIMLGTDESKFEVFGSQRRLFMRRRKNKRLLEE